MCRNDPHSNQVIPPNKKAQQNLFNKVYAQKVRRYYRRARCLNNGEEQNLNDVYRSLDNTKLEFDRCHSADEKIFKLDRRRTLEQGQRIDVKDEIKYLNKMRRLSATPNSLSAAEVISFADTDPKVGSASICRGSSSLPSDTISALYKGLPTVLSQGNLSKTHSRRRSGIQEIQTAEGTVKINSGGEILEPMRLLERIETSANQTKSRERLTTRSASRPTLKQQGLPVYLAMSLSEKQNIRERKKRDRVDSVKVKQAGSEDQCRELVQQWIKETRALF